MAETACQVRLSRARPLAALKNILEKSGGGLSSSPRFSKRATVLVGYGRTLMTKRPQDGGAYAERSALKGVGVLLSELDFLWR